MTWDDGRRWRPDADLPDHSPGEFAVPVVLGLLAGLVVHLALFIVVLTIAVSVSDTSSDFTTGDALLWGTVGALGLAASAAVCGQIVRRLASARGLRNETGRKAALFTALGFAVVVLVLGLAPALRPATLPVYLILGALGAAYGSGYLKRP